MVVVRGVDVVDGDTFVCDSACSIAISARWSNLVHTVVMRRKGELNKCLNVSPFYIKFIFGSQCYHEVDKWPMLCKWSAGCFGGYLRYYIQIICDAQINLSGNVLFPLVPVLWHWYIYLAFSFNFHTECHGQCDLYLDANTGDNSFSLSVLIDYVQRGEFYLVRKAGIFRLLRWSSKYAQKIPPPTSNIKYILFNLLLQIL